MDEAGLERLVFAEAVFQELERDDRIVRPAPGAVDDADRPLTQASIETVAPDRVADARLGAGDHRREHTTSNSPGAVFR
jgi:hypothetical protein